MELEWTEMEHIVPPEEARLRVDVLLSRKYPVVNRHGWQDRIHAGHVRINGALIRPSRKLQAGDRIWIQYHRKKEPEVSLDIRIVYRDSCILIVNKPPNLPVHPSGIYHKNTLQHLLVAMLSGQAPPEEDGTTDTALKGAETTDAKVADYGSREMARNNPEAARENAKEADSGSTQPATGEYRVRPVHRLDRETSGLMLLAESTDCARKLSRIVRRGEIEKEYLVLVEGQFPATEDWYEAAGWIGPDPDSEVRKKQRFWPAPEGRNPAREIRLGRAIEKDGPLADSLGRRACHTDFRLLQFTGELSLIRCRLHTGRMHQIRATLHSLGYPVVGDRMYGVDPEQYLRFIHDLETEEQLKKLRMNRVALHSHALRFAHPQTGEQLSFECDLPADMKILLDQ